MATKPFSIRLQLYRCAFILCCKSPDFAVGAPYEGNGAVYIFRGQDNERGFAEEYSQRLYADDLRTAGELTSFGYSLSGGVDMDDNGYPDLAIGSFQSDKVQLALGA